MSLNNIIVTKMEEIKLSGPEFKALASETRAGIIKLLRGRNHTLTEMSKKLKLAVPTVKQHLGVLEKADLIEELDEGRKWKYYCLTRKGKNIFLHETPVNVFIVLGVSLLALVGLLYSFISMVEGQAMSFFASGGGQMFIAPSASGIVSTTTNAAKESIGETAARTISDNMVTAGASAPAVEAAVVNSPTPFPFEMIVLLFGIVAMAILSGYLIAKTRG